MRQKSVTHWLVVVFLLILLTLYWVHRSRLAIKHDAVVAAPAVQQSVHSLATCYDAKGNPYSQGFVRLSPGNSNAYQVCGPKGKWEPYSSQQKK